MMANKLLTEDLLGKIRFNPQTGYLYLKNKKKFLPELNWESFNRVQEQINIINNNTDESLLTETQARHEINNMLQMFFIKQNENKHLPEKFKEIIIQEIDETEKFMRKGIDM